MGNKLRTVAAIGALVGIGLQPALAEPPKSAYPTAEAATRLQDYGLNSSDAKAVAAALASVGGIAPQTVKMFELVVPSLAARGKISPVQVASDIAGALRGQWAAAERLEVTAKALSPRARDALRAISKAGREGDAAHLYLEILFLRRGEDTRAAASLKARKAVETTARDYAQIAAIAIACGMPEKIVHQLEVAAIAAAIVIDDVATVRQVYTDTFWKKAMSAPELSGDICLDTRTLVDRFIAAAAVKR